MFYGACAQVVRCAQYYRKSISMNAANEKVEQELRYIEGVKRGSAQVIGEIYKLFSPRIAFYIQKKGGKKEDAQDVFQEALIVLMRKVKAPDFELKSSFYSFLFGICRNIWLQKIIPETKRKTLLDHQESVVYMDKLWDVSKEREALYHKCLQMLSRDNRRIIELSMEEYSYQEISTILNIKSYGYLRIKKMRAKNELANLMRQDPLYKELAANGG